MKGDKIKVKKKGWKAHRELGFCLKVKVVPQGNSATISPSIPLELVGEECFIVFPNYSFDKKLVCDKPEED